ncbi:MAG TPA: adenylate/guanylate cyclase domain-containing protein [Flavisolibacter sp.]|jgi:TolB-like protein/class 3 adenylate cyclase|nr:adenylate/guanylate cyclase domain-containing protein [Flavisolibacter sp.]
MNRSVTQHRRQLAAIMFADIEGYSSLMQENEEQAIQWRARYRETLESQHQQYEGRIIQFYGDGTLSIFSSAVNAVACALAMQQAFQQPPALPVRIGLHSGDIVFDDNQIFGDSVNVTSRIESLGVAGSVLLSEKIIDEIGNHPEFKTVSVGSYQFKNIRRKMEVFALNHPGLVVPAPNSLKGKLAPQSRNAPPAGGTQASGPIEKSIAVLPFVNLSNDPEQEYFSQGVGEEILNSLSKLKDLKVVSRSSSFQFDARHIDLQEVKEKLGVKTALQGSIRKQGRRLRLMVQLVNLDTGLHLWSEKYDRDLDDVFAVQDEVALSITEKLKCTLLENDRELITKNPTTNVGAYELYLKGRYYMNKRGGTLLMAIQALEQAITVDPGFMLAHTACADAYLMAGFYGLLPPSEVTAKARKSAETALQLDAEACEPYATLGYLYTCFEWNWEEAEKNFLQSLAINSRYAQAHFWYGCLYLAWVKGDFMGAITHGRIAIELEPLSPLALGLYGSILHSVGQYAEAVTYCKKGADEEPDSFICHLYLGLSYLALRRYKEGIDVLEQLSRVSRKFHLAQNVLAIAYCKVWKFAKAQQILNELKERAATEYVSHSLTGIALASLEELDEAFVHLEQAFEEQEPLLLTLKYQSWIPDTLREDPRYEPLLRRIGFS